jgi:DNA-binding NtrC family response regulator
MLSPGTATTGDPRVSKKARLMIVDDDPAVLETLELALTWEGHDVVKAESGAAAVEVARTAEVDLVLTDFKMSGMNGLETMLAIKEVNPSVPVLIITGFVSDEMEDEFKRCGAFAIVTKPFTLDDLFEAVRQALEPSTSVP